MFLLNLHWLKLQKRSKFKFFLHKWHNITICNFWLPFFGSLKKNQNASDDYIMKFCMDLAKLDLSLLLESSI